MPSLGCLWNRSRIEPFADVALPARAMRAVARHLTGCASCRARMERLTALRSQVRGVASEPRLPDWSGFWTVIRSRIEAEPARPLREPWWLPFWKPVWGHPRLALATGLATVTLLSVSFWPADEGELLPAWGPVMVQDVATGDPDGSVMVYSDSDRGAERGVTVIWLFASR
jgi:anti-sigma factor RsiW